VRAAVGATAHLGRDLPEVGVVAASAPRATRAAFWTSLTSGSATARSLRPGVDRIYLDSKFTLALDVSVPQVGTPAAWQQGLDGTGVTVAVLDSGIDASHPDFAGRIGASRNFSSATTVDDLWGHGTHVASIIAGSGAASGGRYRGVAPGVQLAIGKVCEYDLCTASAMLAGMQWAASIAPVVNMSIGGPDSPGLDPLEQAVEDLTAAHGTLFVIAAGNNGAAGAGTVTSPGTADSALTVGAVNDQDQLALFSGRGPRIGDAAIKPDITAPGVGIVAAHAANGTDGVPVVDGYVSMNGTSMSTPHVAGAAAIVTQQHPDWSPKRRKALLMGAATPIDGQDVFQQGAGRLDVARAVRQQVSTDEGSLSFGTQSWPHTDETPVTKTLTYRNSDTEPITLDLALRGATDTFTLAATSLTVPAGGSATTTVTADTRSGSTDGLRTASIVATAPDDVRVQTPLAVEREVETCDVTFRSLGRDGQPATNSYTNIIRLDASGSSSVWSSEQTIRLPKGEYGIDSMIFTSTEQTMLVQTSLVVDGPTTVMLDAQQARPVQVTPPRAEARQFMTEVGANWVTSHGVVTTSAVSMSHGDLYTAQIGPTASKSGFLSTVNSVSAQWENDTDGFRRSPYSYHIADAQNGSFYTGLDKQVTAEELATVKVRYARNADGGTGLKANVPAMNGKQFATIALPVSLPLERTEYLSTQGGVLWATNFREMQTDPKAAPQTIATSYDLARRFEPGTVYDQGWNRAPFAPSVSAAVGTVARASDTISASIQLFNDNSGHFGGSAAATSARTALYADDTLIKETAADTATFGVPAESRRYRLEMSATRAAPIRLSTAVSGVWTFTSAHGDTRLPLSSVRLAPALDADNSAPAGDFTVPVTVERATGSPATSNQTLTAEFSTDDGTTWQPATVTGGGDQRTLQVTNPATGFVSLRINATDTAGNTATITVIHAYAIR
jgi:subtilisin family serine protease